MTQTISVIGLGKLGSTYCAFCASRGFHVIGVDVDKDKVGAINRAVAPVSETGLDELVRKNKARLRATTDIGEAVAGSQITLIIVPTPSKTDGSFSVRYVLDACAEIGRALRDKKAYHLVSLMSTVLPRDCRADIIPVLEEHSGKKCGTGFGFCYSPSLIAIGNIIEDLRHPDILFIGQSDARAGDVLERAYKKIYPGVSADRMSIESAELAKIALNAYVTTKITFANVLGQLCEEIPHADVDSVTRALGKDKRIGKAYLSSGLGYGGPCFPRDNFAFAHMADRHGVEAEIAHATHSLNESIPKRIASLVHSISRESGIRSLGFLGMSYKTKTQHLDESQALAIARELMKRRYALAVHDPMGSHEVAKAFGKAATYPDSVEELVRTSDLIFISNKDASFISLPEIVNKRKKSKWIIDPWGMFKKSDFKPHVQYRALGRK